MVANFRLKTGHDCLAAHLRKIGIYESSECTICQMPYSTMDEEHLLYCPKLNTDQQVLKNTKLYWDATVITSPPYAIGTTSSDLFLLLLLLSLFQFHVVIILCLWQVHYLSTVCVFVRPVRYNFRFCALNMFVKALCARTFMVHSHTKFDMPSFNDPLLIYNQAEILWKFYTAAV